LGLSTSGGRTGGVCALPVGDCGPATPRFLTGARHPPLTVGEALHTMKYGKNPSIEIASFRFTFSTGELSSRCLCAAMANFGHGRRRAGLARRYAGWSGGDDARPPLDHARAIGIRPGDTDSDVFDLSRRFGIVGIGLDLGC
jgi:hypothetical protein